MESCSKAVLLGSMAQFEPACMVQVRLACSAEGDSPPQGEWHNMHDLASHVHVSRPVVPDRCRRTPDCSYDGTFGLYLCNVKSTPCFFRGPVYVLTGETRQFECRKRATLEEEAAAPAR